MAQLTEQDRKRIWAGLMRYWSNFQESIALSKVELLAAVDATDIWIDNNQAAYNSALPQVAQDNLLVDQKTLLFCAVALMRVDPGLGVLLRRALDVEVD